MKQHHSHAFTLGFVCAVLLLGARVAIADSLSMTNETPVIDLAFFRPDKYTFTDCNWTEGWSYKEQFYPKYAALAGAFHIYIQNPSSSELTITKILLNGKTLMELRQEFEVCWWKITPNPISPKGFAEVIIRIRSPLKTSVNHIALYTDGDKVIECKIDSNKPKLNIAYVGFSKAIDALYAYVESEDGIIPKSIFLDGKNITSQARFLPQFKNISFIKVKLSEPLAYGTYHAFKVVTSDGNATAHMLRAWDSWFDISFWGYPAAPSFMKEHYFDTDRRAWGGDGVSGKSHEEIVKMAEAWKGREFVAYYLCDEPDAMDYTAGAAVTKDIALRLGYSAQGLADAAAIIRTVDPARLTCLEVDNTYKPSNWNVYGELADIMYTDPYAIQDAINPKTLYYVVDAVQQAYEACSPRPLDVTLGAFFLRGKSFQRLPTPDEERIMLYYAIGCGAKGINYFIWGSDAHLAGVNESPALQEELGQLNAELQVCAPLLSISHPIKIKTIKSSEKALWTRALMAGKGNLVLVLVNGSYRYEDWKSKDGKYTLDPLENVMLEIETPPWLEVNDVCRINFDGIEKLNWKKTSKDKIEIRVNEVKAGGMVVLTQDSSPLYQRYKQKVESVRKAH